MDDGAGAADAGLDRNSPDRAVAGAGAALNAPVAIADVGPAVLEGKDTVGQTIGHIPQPMQASAFSCNVVTPSR